MILSKKHIIARLLFPAMLFAVFFAVSESLQAQISRGVSFGATIAALPMGYEVCSADFDGDGYEDFIASGPLYEGTYGEVRTRVYRNNRNGSFSFSGQELFGFNRSKITTGDFDDDNDIDFIISGYYYNSSDNLTRLSIMYRNNGGMNFSVVYNGVFPNSFDGSYAWGDYDSDGDQDIFFIGKGSDNAKLYRNNGGGAFAEIEIGIEGLTDGDAEWGDYDNDGDLDLLVNGEDSIRNRITRIYKNVEGEFTSLNIELLGVKFSNADWADYDGDGDLDFLITGRYTSSIYLNEGKDRFSFLNTQGLIGLEDGVAKWGDFDQDGDLDILLCGEWGWYEGIYHYIGDIYAYMENLGNHSFARRNIRNPGISHVNGADWIDYDNDGDLDVLISDTYKTFLVENSSSLVTNNSPTIPIGLSTEQIGSSIVLKWKPSTDNESDDATIKYNVRFGHYSNAAYLLSPMANYYYGNPYVRQHGNALFATEKVLHNVPPRHYYWSVQAIDGSGKTSRFSSNGSVDMKPFFSEIFNDNTIDYEKSAVCWGDYNNDGYMDAFSNGVVFTNNAGSGFSFSFNLDHPEFVSHAQWVDYDNDGDLDISFCGYNTLYSMYIHEGEFYVYEYNHTTNTFTRDTDLPVEGVAIGNFWWKDFNSDGLKDLIITGLNFSEEETIRGIARFYLNSKTEGLLEAPIPLRADEFGTCYTEDLDGDLDYDIIFSEHWGDYTTTLINDGSGAFTVVDKGFMPVAGDYAFADYDYDGDIDVMIAGEDSIRNKRTMIWRNTNGNFENIYANLPGLTVCTINWMDTDGDHDLDLYIFGSETLKKSYHVENMGNEEYSIEEITNIPLTSGTQKLGDFDNDGDPDILISGLLDGSISVAVYENNYNEVGSAPSPPQNPISDLEGFDVVLSWEEPNNNHGAAIGYGYDVRVGTASGRCDVVAPESNPQTGFIRTMHLGNASVNREMRLRDLPLGTYYWSVLAINQGYQASNWTEESSFTITRVSPEFDFDTVCAGLATTFTDHSITSDVLKAWRWDFGDGTESFEQNPNHIFHTGGKYSVTLWAFSESGDSASITQDVRVLESPVVQYSSPNVCDREEVIFTDLSETGSLSGLTYEWAFGDGSTSFSQSSVSHLYSNPGTYTTSLHISADNGCSDERVSEVTMAEDPEAGVALVPGYDNTFCSKDSSILAVPYNAKYKYQWQLNQSNIFDANDTSIVVKGPSGIYSVLVEDTVHHCISQGELEIQVDPAPEVPLIDTENYTEGGCPGKEPIILSVTNLESNTTYRWIRDYLYIPGVTESSYSGAKAEGLYSVEASKDNCRVNSDTLRLIFGDMPDKPTIHVRGPEVWYLVCSNDQASSYEWYFDQELIPGADEYIYLPGNRMGSYEVAIAENEGCFAFSDPVRIPLGTGMEQEDIWKNLKIYPNPTPGLFTLEMDNTVMGELVIDILSETGAMVLNIKFQKETTHFKTEIDLSGQAPSVYLINLVLEQYMANRKLIVKQN